MWQLKEEPGYESHWYRDVGLFTMRVFTASVGFSWALYCKGKMIQQDNQPTKGKLFVMWRHVYKRYLVRCLRSCPSDGPGNR